VPWGFTNGPSQIIRSLGNINKSKGNSKIQRSIIVFVPVTNAHAIKASGCSFVRVGLEYYLGYTPQREVNSAVLIRVWYITLTEQGKSSVNI
jgi:hypothetical protein